MLPHAICPCFSFTARQNADTADTADTLDNQRQASILTLSRALLASNPIERRRGPCLPPELTALLYHNNSPLF